MPTLWIFGRKSPRSIELKEPEVTIGRAEGNTIRVKDPTISKRHARLFEKNGAWHIEDLGSVNGTWLYDERIEQARLEPGTKFKLGKHEFRLDEYEVEEDSIQEITSRGTMFTSMQAIPSAVFQEQVFEAEDDEDSQLSRIGVALKPPDGFDRKSTQQESFEEKKLRLMRTVGEAVIHLTELNGVAEEILGIMVEELGADRGFICQFAEDGSAGLPLASYGVDPSEKVVFSKTVCNEMLNNRSGILMSQESESRAISASLEQSQVRSTICVPLWTKDRITGFVSMDITQPGRAFSKEDLELLISVSHQAAIGLERSRLGELALEERRHRDYLCQFFDHKLIKSVLSSSSVDDPLAPREQVITVLFGDIVGFTNISEGMPPQDLAAFIQDHFTAMTDILFKHNGTVDKYIGDAVMALFGAPVGDDEAPKMAVEAALAMRQYVKDFSEPAVQLRFGIATGMAVVGNIGSAQRREYTAIGDTVNVASRLESFARPNEIIVDERTANALRDSFGMQTMGRIEVRNRQEPVQAFAILHKLNG